MKIRMRVAALLGIVGGVLALCLPSTYGSQAYSPLIPLFVIFKCAETTLLWWNEIKRPENECSVLELYP